MRIPSLMLAAFVSCAVLGAEDATPTSTDERAPGMAQGPVAQEREERRAIRRDGRDAGSEVRQDRRGIRSDRRDDAGIDTRIENRDDLREDRSDRQDIRDAQREAGQDVRDSRDERRERIGNRDDRSPTGER